MEMVIFGETMICPHCQKEFEPKRPHQRFCSNGCRVNHFAESDGGLRGIVSSVRKMKRGTVSIVLRFTPLEAADALKLSPGEVVALEGPNAIRRSGNALKREIYVCRRCAEKFEAAKFRFYCSDQCRNRPGPNGENSIEHPLYDTWSGMFKRCHSPSDAAYKYYGARGILVCEEWEDFWKFVADMGERPDGTTIDRIDNDGPYAAWNCRWATDEEQANNRSNNKRIEFGGESLTQSQWARKLGISATALYRRIKEHGERRAIEMGGDCRFVSSEVPTP